MTVGEAIRKQESLKELIDFSYNASSKLGEINKDEEQKRVFEELMGVEISTTWNKLRDIYSVLNALYWEQSEALDTVEVGKNYLG